MITEEYVNGIKVTNIIDNVANMASDNVKQERRNICNDCEFRREEICSKCECILDVITSLELSECPAGKW